MSDSLKPKIIHARRQVWLRLKELGYHSLIPIRDKTSPFPGYAKLSNRGANTPAHIMQWQGYGSALLMQGSGLIVFDLDTRLVIARDGILTMMERRWPAFMDGCLRRHSGGIKLALIGRCEDARVSTLATGSFYPAPEDVPQEGDTPEVKDRKKELKNQGEIFTTKSPRGRYVAVEGRHSPGKEYGYLGKSILDTPYLDLPIFPHGDIVAMRDACDEVMAGLGLAPRPKEHRLEGVATREVYDLTPDMKFTYSDGEDTTLEALSKSLRHGDKEEGYATMFDPTSGSRDRIKALRSRKGLLLWDSKFGTHHYFADPEMRGEFDPAKLAEKITELQQRQRETGQQVPPVSDPPGQNQNENARNGQDDQSRNKEPPPRRQASHIPMPADNASLPEHTSYLLDTHAYCAPLDAVVKLYEPSDNCLLKMIGFQRLFRRWHQVRVGDRGGQHLDYATSAWELHRSRINVRGFRMHPGASFPLFCDDCGDIYKNTYQPPRHEGDGDLAVWEAFITHLLPDPVEREWFLDWLAHKFQHPEIPSVAVIMVAVDAEGRPVYGAGRGMLKDILSRLFGWSYVRPIDFDVFNGRSAQGVYTDWAAYALIVFVSESRDSVDAGRWAERRAVYERIKEVVDPRPVLRTFTSKGKPAFQGVAYASYLIASNNGDAVQIPAGDRRITALRNGPSMTESMAQALDAWMNVPGNIAALARMLAARNLSEFDAYSPLPTATKAVMQELALSEMDEWLIDVRKRLGPEALFTIDLLLNAAIRDLGREGDTIDFQVRLKRRLRNEAKQVPSLVLNLRTARGHDNREHRIMCWRGYSGPEIQNTPVARELVERSRAILLEGKDGGDPAALLARLHIHKVEQ
jgi:hypothetical protein